MSIEEEYNKLMSDKLNARSFEASEQDWDAALALIEAHDKKKKRRFLFWILPTGGLLLTGVIIFALLPSQTDHNLAVAQAKDELTTIAQPQAKVEELTTLSAEEQKNKSENKTSTQTKEVETTAVVNTAQKSGAEKNERKKDQKQVVTEGTPENKPSNGAHENKDGATTTKKKRSETNTTSNSAKQEEKIVAVIPKIEKEEKRSEITSLASNPSIKKEPEAAITTTVTSTETATLIPKEETASTTTPEKNDPVVVPEKEVAKVDSAAKTEKILEPIVPSTSRFEFYALGAGQFTPIKDPSQKFFDKINPMGGLYFVRSFVNGFGFGSGLFYSVYSASTLDPRVYRSVGQEFGYKALVTEIAPDKLHYGRVPLFLTYSFKKNRIFAGVQTSYIALVRSKVYTYNEAYGVNNDQKTEHTFGYTNGISKFDVSINLAFSRTVYQKFGLGIGMDYGFKDVKDNAYFSSNKFDRNISFQLLLTYKLR